MITRKQVITAMKILRGEVHPMDATLKQIVGSLLVYKQRGEFTGYLEEAIECLERAQYEIEPRMKTEYKNVDTSTLKGLKQAERLHAQGWVTGRVGLFIIQFYRTVKKS